jgi:hypothetical protein
MHNVHQFGKFPKFASHVANSNSTVVCRTTGVPLSDDILCANQKAVPPGCIGCGDRGLILSIFFGDFSQRLLPGAGQA